MESNKMKEKLSKHKPDKIRIPNMTSSSGSQSGGHPDTDPKYSPFDSSNKYDFKQKSTKSL